MELGESATETALREVFEETGLKVEVEHLIGAYTKYFDEYPNGDKAQTISFFFQCKPIEGSLKADENETLELAYFPITNLPPLFVEQHQDAFEDFLAQRRGCIR